jgi:hypothetical protein
MEIPKEFKDIYAKVVKEPFQVTVRVIINP